MGLLDQLQQLAGANGGNVMEQIQKAIGGNGGNVLGELMKNPQVAQMLQNIDQNKINAVVDHFMKNGIPNNVGEITALIQKLTK